MAEAAGTEDILTRACRRARIVAITGANFSGRSSLLRTTVGLGEQDGDLRTDTPVTDGVAIYVGPEIYNSISGLTSMSIDELRIHGLRGTTSSFIENLIATTQLDELFERNPFVLSGGEQSCLVLATSLLLSPTLLALDGALEQIAPELRGKIFTILQNADENRSQIIVSDNRIGELGSLVESIQVQKCIRTKERMDYLPIGPFVPDAINNIPVASAKRIVLDGVSFNYPKSPDVLRSVSAVLDPGHPYVLTGGNGSGKSTLAKLLVGILKPTRGKLLLGASVFTPWLHPGRVVGYHFQNPDLQLFETSVFAELHGANQILNNKADCDNEQVNMILEAFGLTNVANVHPLGLSFPFVLRKRVALAATLSMRTDWVVLDEPTLGQDESSTQAIAKMVHNLIGLGKGVIVISHSLRLLDLLNAKRLTLANGTLSS